MAETLPAIPAKPPAKTERVEFEFRGRKVIVTYVEINWPIHEYGGDYGYRCMRDSGGMVNFKMEGYCDRETAQMLWEAVAAARGHF